MRTILTGTGALLVAVLLGLASGSIGRAASLADTTPPTFATATEIALEATGAGGAAFALPAATDDTDPSPVVSCSVAAGTMLALGTHDVTCTATDTTGNTTPVTTFHVVVQDTTAPAIVAHADVTVPATGPSTTVTYTAPTATDVVDPAPAVSCAPASGTGFAAGPTSVTCTAKDAALNTSSLSFNVVVEDTTAPVIAAGHADVTVPATGSSTTVTYTSPAATDAVDPAPTVTCAPASGSGFAVGTTSVSCTAKDASGNTSSPATFSVIVQDSTAPTISLSAPANGAKLNGAVTLSATAADNVAVTGVSFHFCDSTSAACTPGGTGLAGAGTGAAWTATVPAAQLTDGHTYTWGAVAGDGAGQSTTSGTRSFVVDRTVPVLALPSPRTIEADTHAGAAVTYTVSATDNGQPLAPSAITCSPVSGAVFPIAVTTVNCTTAADPGGNVATGSFTVTVRDTTPPTLNVPGNTTVYATSAAGIPAVSAAVAALLNAGRAVDLVDPSPSVTNDAPAVFARGTTTVTFTATDATGNAATKAFRLTVVDKPAAGGGSSGGGGSTAAASQPKAVDTTPPANPGSVVAKPGPGYVHLSWKLPADKDFDHVVVLRSSDRGTSGPAESSVYSGKGTSYVDRAVTVGTRYRYLVASFDAAGNRSAGMVATATATAVLLLAPADGATLRAAPALRWKKVAQTAYYNVQLFRGTTKILSGWPTGTTLRLAPAWRYEGKRYTLAAGTYHWYVWPGLGARSAGRYGVLLGDRLFTLVKAVAPKSAPAKSAGGTAAKATLRAKKGYAAWVAWTLGEGAWKPYGASNRSVRPAVQAKVPASWLSRRAKLLADRRNAKP